MSTFTNVLLRRADDDHPALLFEDEVVTYRRLVAAAQERAAALRHLRRPGPFHVGVLLDNVPEYLFWIAGAALARATVVGINPTRRGEALAADIRHTDCQLLVSDRHHVALLDGLDTGVDDDRVVLLDDPAYAALLDAAAGGDPPGDQPVDGDVLLLLFTSGSTGAPKAVICTQGRFGAIAERTPERLGISGDDVLYQSMPLFHGNALMANWAPALAAGATVALRRRFSASGFLPDVRRYRATWFNYVGRALAYVLATPEQPDDADNTLRMGFGTEASGRDIERFSERFGCTIVERYGSSEGAITIARVDGAPEGSLGRPDDGLDVAIVDADGRECPPARFDAEGRLLNASDAIGEIVCRNGAERFEGYYRNPEAEAARLRDGWYWSGDLGYRDGDGWLWFAGRDADWLRVDSENFAAAPIERILHRHPAVVMAAVYPVPDPRTGDQVMAALELADGARLEPADLASFLADQADLGTKWTPRFVRLVPSMPLTSTNKVDKAPLRAARWETSDPVWWRPPGQEGYLPLTDDDAAALRRQLDEHGRTGALA